MAISKRGIISSSSLYESVGKNLVSYDCIGKSYKYTPSTGINSCLGGYMVDFSSCSSGEKLYIKCKLDWSGFDNSNTNGAFSSWMQGSNYNATKSTWEWKGTNSVAAAINNYFGGNLTSTLLGSTNGSKVIELSTTLNSSFPGTYTKSYVGFRCDYSNGIGWIQISNLVVVQSRYYASNSTEEKMYIAKNYISANEIMEI